MASRAEQGGMLVSDYVHRNPVEHIGEAAFVGEGFPEKAFSQDRQDARRDAAAQVNTARCQDLQRQVASFTA